MWVSLGAMIALGLALLLTKSPTSPLLLASLGGSTIFLFGHLISALIGIICYQLFSDALWVYLLAEVITLAVLLITQTVHPPAGANPLIMIQAHAGFDHLLAVVLVGVTILAVVAAIWSRLIPGKTLRYPVRWNEPSPASTNWSVWG
jgi:CBS-domain-containing membrane protein